MSDYLNGGDRQLKNFGAPAVADSTPFGNDAGLTPTPASDLDPVFAQGGNLPPQTPAPAFEPEFPASNSVVAPVVADGVETEPGFTIVEQDCTPFAQEFSPQMDLLNYIGNTNMLLQYLFTEERKHKVTMPIKACGIDPRMFEHVEYAVEEPEDGEEGAEEPTNVFTISVDVNGDTHTSLYELITVDGSQFMSCMSECLDEAYLHQIIAEATLSMRESGQYIFRMVGLRRLAIDNGTTGQLLETLRLNTFEMSALCSYMEGFDVEPSFEVINKHQCICFRSK